MWCFALRPALSTLAFLAGLAAHAALAGGDPSLALADQVPPVERAREHEWHKLYEAAGMAGSSGRGRVYEELVCVRADGMAEGRLLELPGAVPVCEVRGGGVYLPDGTYDRLAKGHSAWSLKNLSFVREVGTEARAQDYVNSHNSF